MAVLVSSMLIPFGWDYEKYYDFMIKVIFFQPNKHKTEQLVLQMQLLRMYKVKECNKIVCTD